MKIYVPVLTALIGIGIGWLAKPAAPASVPAAPEKQASRRAAPVTPAPAPSTPAEDVTFTDRPATRPSIPAVRNMRAAQGANS